MTIGIKSKIHRVVTGANYIRKHYHRPIDGCSELIPGGKVQVVNGNNGERLETYVIQGMESGESPKWPRSPKSTKGIFIIMSYAQINPNQAKSFQPKIIFPDTQTNTLR